MAVEIHDVPDSSDVARAKKLMAEFAIVAAAAGVAREHGDAKAKEACLVLAEDLRDEADALFEREADKERTRTDAS